MSFNKSPYSLQIVLPKLKLLTAKMYHNPINKLLFSKHNDIKIQIEYQQNFNDIEEFHKRYYALYEIQSKITMLTQYYKYHIEIPRIFINEVQWILQQNYAEKRQHSYDNLSRKMKYLRTRKQNSYNSQFYPNILPGLDISTNFYHKQNGISIIQHIDNDRFDDFKQLNIFNHHPKQKNAKILELKQKINRLNSNKNANSCQKIIDKIRKTIKQVNWNPQQPNIKTNTLFYSKSMCKLYSKQQSPKKISKQLLQSLKQQKQKFKKQKSMPNFMKYKLKIDNTIDSTQERNSSPISAKIKIRTIGSQANPEVMISLKEIPYQTKSINQENQQKQKLFKKLINTKRR